MGRQRIIITVLGALVVLGMIAVYFLFIDPANKSETVVRPGIADADAADFDPFGEGESRSKGAGSSGDTKGRDGGDSALDPSGMGRGKGGPGAEGEGAAPAEDAGSTPKFDPEEVNQPVPGHLLVRVVDRTDERPLSGASVYFPIRGAALKAEAGDVQVESRIAGMAKRANRHGVVIWSQDELAKLIAEQAESGNQPTSVLATNIGYADLFEPLAIPDLAKGAEVTFKMMPSVRVNGKVREKRGGAVQYAKVDILQTTGQADAAAPANRFSIEADALGEFTLKLADSYLYTFEVKMSGYAQYTSRVFNFREDSREVTILLEPARGISGIVVGAGGKPIEGANVEAKDDGLSVTTDAEGKFAFDMVADRIFRNDVNLRATAKGYAPLSQKVLANDHNVRFELETEGTLSGVVCNEKDEPIGGAVVECTYLEGNARYPYDAAISDAEGKFTFGQFGNGRVLLTGHFQGLYAEAATIDVRPKTNAGPVKLLLKTGAAITGIVSSGGKGIAGVTLALDGKATTATGADGAYTIAGVGAGKRRVKIVNEYPIADEQLRQLPIFTTDGQHYYYLPTEVEVDLKLAETKTHNFDVQAFEADVDRKITVNVVTQPSESATGVQVTIKPVFGAPPAGVEAPKVQVIAIDLPEGKASLPLSLLNGVSYEATFVHNRFFTATLSAESLAGVQDGGVIEVVLERAFIIKGHVKDSEGAGLESVGLSKDKNNPWNLEVTTDIYGYFEFGQLKAGEYTITAFKNSYYQEAKVVLIEDADPEPLQITLVGANEIRIIVANNGVPQAGAQVDIYRNDAEGDNPDDYKRHFDIGTTDANGEKYINFHWVRNYQIVAQWGGEVAFVNFNNLREEPEREFTIELEAGYDLKGRVVDKDTAQPLPGVFIRAHIAPTGVEGRDGNFFQQQTDGAGNFNFRVPAGDFSFYVPKTATHQSFNTQGSEVPAGTLNLQLDVPLRDDIEGNYAQVLSFSVPTSMVAGQEYTATVTVKNVGNTTWTSTGNKPWRLGSQGPQDNTTWGMNRVPIPEGQTVQPKDTFTFTITVTAPATAGTYDMQWQMVQDGVQWFGQKTQKLTITVEQPTGE
jgi:hypothetical protein